MMTKVTHESCITFQPQCIHQRISDTAREGVGIGGVAKKRGLCEAYSTDQAISNLQLKT